MWPEEITKLRPILLNCGLVEEFKWEKPCYCHDGENVVILQEMKSFLALMFFKGALLTDSQNVLVDHGPNSRSARRIQISSKEDVIRLADTIKTLVSEAIEVEKSGKMVGPTPKLKLVAELQRRLDREAALRTAFEALTPGRQREYNLYFSNAKQEKTRMDRIEKFAPKILNGEGLRDR